MNMFNGFSVYGQSDCKWCEKATALLDDTGCFYSYADISDPSAKARIAALNLPKVTVPQIFLAGRHIGGYNDLKTFLEAKQYASTE